MIAPATNPPPSRDALLALRALVDRGLDHAYDAGDARDPRWPASQPAVDWLEREEHAALQDGRS